MFATGPEDISPTIFTQAATAAGIGDLRPIYYGLLLLLAMAFSARLISAAADQVRDAYEAFKYALRTIFLAIVVAILVAALVLLAFADFVAQG
jgi:hypothetical protein